MTALTIHCFAVFAVLLGYSHSQATEKNGHLSLGQCGLINRTRTGFRTIGRSLAKLGEFPWQASVRSRDRHHCGGTLIHSKWVVTAAHCFHDESDPDGGWKVLLGSVNLNKRDGTEQIIQVKQVVSHPDFNNPVFANDIALLELATEAELNEAVNYVCLPTSKYVFDGDYCTATGFEATDKEEFAQSLMKLRKPIAMLKPCQAYHCKFGTQIYDKNLCAGITIGGRDACRGDSGGPLACPKKDKSNNIRWVLAGIVSYGEECGLEEAPGVYTHVGHYVDWIQHVTNIKFPEGTPMTEEEKQSNPFVNTPVTIPYKCKGN